MSVLLLMGGGGGAGATSHALRPHDRVRLQVSVVAGQKRPVDLAESASGWLYRASRSGAQVIVERSLDAGVTWTASVVATDAAQDSGGNDGAAPSLLITTWDEVMVWYHTSTPTIKGYRSSDGGATWTLHQAAYTGNKFPRLAVHHNNRVGLVVHDGTNLLCYMSEDWGASTSALLESIAMPVQRVSLLTDRHGSFRLTYKNAGGAVVQRHSADGDTWSAETVMVAAGEYPSMALGHTRAWLAYFVGTTLTMQVLDDSYAAVSAAVTPPTGAFEKTYTGALVDKHGWWDFAGALAGVIAQRYSSGDGAAWGTPT